MFIKFEKPKKDVYINRDHIVSIELNERDGCPALSFYLINGSFESYYYFKFETKAQAEKVLDGMFSKAYQDNTLIVFGKESGLKE